jgi:two-component system phosphate regulon response regulator PhoB
VTPTILVVEDEPAILELLKVNLADAGYDVKGAADAEAAKAAIKGPLPDLVLLDWMLPGQSGIAFARELRADTRTRELPIIMVSARGEESDRVAGLEAVGRRLRHQAVLAARAQGAHQGGAAAARARVGAGAARGRADPARPDDAPRDRRREAAAPRSDRVPAAALPARAPRARAYARAAARPGLGRPRLHRGAHGRRAHPRLRVALEPFGVQDLIETVRGAGYRIAAPR